MTSIYHFCWKTIIEVTPFAFQPMYSEDKIDKRLRAYRLAENNTTNTSETREVGKSTDISWCQCTRPMESEIERKCCKSSPEIPDRKFEGGVCISESDGFQPFTNNIYMLDLWKARQRYPKTYLLALYKK